MNHAAAPDREIPYAPPPELVFRGETPPEPTRVRIFDFSSGDLLETEARSLDEIVPYLNTSALTWIDWVGLQDVALLSELGLRLGVHTLHIEDLIHTDQRPKVEESENYTLLFARRIHRAGTEERYTSSQLALVLTPTTLLTVRERDLGLFDSVQARLRLSKGRIRSMGCDYLAYALLDALIDSYFAVLEEMQEEIDALQDEVLDEPVPEHMVRIHDIRSHLLESRKGMSPLREVLGALARSDLIQPGTAPFLRDAYEHTIKVADTIEFARDQLGATMDNFMTATSNRMNESIRLLTVLSVIFMPLTFIAGVYGMNFEHMPELRWRCGYPAVWIVMMLAALVMIAVFRRKRWI